MRGSMLASVCLVLGACSTNPGGSDATATDSGVTVLPDGNVIPNPPVDSGVNPNNPDGGGNPNNPDGGGNPNNPDGGGAGLGPVAFRRGVNPGYYGSGIDRRESAQLSVRAGANSIRTPLPESYLLQWGEAIEVGDYNYYATLGVDHLVVFIAGPTAEHSTAPPGTASWELDHYSPKNLYEPIFLANGTVNPNNYFAVHCDKIARNYGPHTDVYEVWNEPDQVNGNWQATTQWNARAPTPAELVWWHDTIYAYVRALRIAHEVIHRADPTAQVTVGGVGYSNFLRAVLRYTDNPNGGAVSTEFPHTGASYLDVLSYHYYPVFGGGSSDRGVDGFFESRDQMRAALQEYGRGDLNFVVTESGAPRYALGSYPGGADYSANYVVKLMTLAHYEGFVGVDWFAQGDGKAQGASQDSFDYMGLYFNYAAATAPSGVNIAPQGAAYAWLATWLDGTAAKPAALQALALPTTVRGAAFAAPNNAGTRYVLWARTTANETATATYAFAASAPVRVRTFALSGGESAEMKAPSGGVVMLSLTGMPTVVDVP